jgi:branched-chain amino acid transport system permease protein
MTAVANAISTRVQQLGLWVPLALLAVVPLVTSNPYLLSVWTFIAITLIIVVGLDLLLGYCGQLSLGHGVFVSIGAYASALLTTRAGWSGWAAIPVGMVAAGVAALLVGIPTMRLRGYYLAMATLGFPVVFDAFVRQWSDFTGGSSGVVAVPRLRLGGYVLKGEVSYYLFVLAVFAVVLFVVAAVARSRWGLSLRAVHRDETAAEARGIHVHRAKVIAFVISAVVAGLSGSLYAHYVQFVAPDTFGILFSIMLVVMVVVGGAGRLWGAIVGTIALMWLPEALRSTSTWEPIAFGAVLAAVMLFAPAGVAGLWRRAPSITASPALRERARAAAMQPGPAAVSPLRRAGSQPPVLSIKDLAKHFGGVRAVHGLSFELRRGAIRAIIGPNGAGKSTALALIAGAVRPDQGRIELDGVPVERLPAHARARLGIGRTFQHTRLIGELTVLENVLIGANAQRGRHRTPADDAASAWAVVERVGLGDVADRLPGEINQYQMRLTEIAMALAGDPRVLLLDEPGAGLSKMEVDQLATLLRTERQRGRSILLVDHVMQLVLTLADDILVLEHGSTIAEGPPDVIVRDHRVTSAYLGTRQGNHA